MTANDSNHTPNNINHENGRPAAGIKAATKTTEFFAYVVMVIATIITALVVGDNGENGGDPFNAAQAMQYITYLTIGYMIARGLAKSGNRHTNHA